MQTNTYLPILSRALLLFIVLVQFSCKSSKKTACANALYMKHTDSKKSVRYHKERNRQPYIVKDKVRRPIPELTFDRVTASISMQDTERNSRYYEFNKPVFLLTDSLPKDTHQSALDGWKDNVDTLTEVETVVIPQENSSEATNGRDLEPGKARKYARSSLVTGILSLLMGVGAGLTFSFPFFLLLGLCSALAIGLGIKSIRHNPRSNGPIWVAIIGIFLGVMAIPLTYGIMSLLFWNF